MTLYTLLCFLGASIALTVAPGPDNIFVMTQGVARGRKPAIVTALGMCSGVTVHTTAAAFGISAVFYSSAIAFTVVKSAGAAYLLYLAFKTLKERSAIRLSAADDLPAAALFRRGFIMNVLNPKVAMFFLAFLPQFVAPAAGRVPLQMLLLGLIFMVQSVVIFCLLGYFAGSIGSFILARPRIARYFDWLTAGVFLSLGVRLALAER
ncbi:Lysine exporter protein (LYSE/YGGA) [Geobacter metallireducens RCH3]|uniref:Transporter, RhtB family n=1 Tax=Geobacter metallireducens (strain ATCC 53774 / DSM 7210 / GS-15) TaxID=269799 RepID=Q39XI4_GEOMG|nr:LysE family translocator [Geobacter metallireducens]ABB31040.1 transporter, RhtB family [Geobacter metallireducens GS-15]EHP86046.1 Lysine exporter protein (LYSE/YGGA) [Geobacter metallireducens RCH3]